MAKANSAILTVLPRDAKVLTVSYEQMSANYNLLTTAMVCQVHVEITKVNVRHDFAMLKFDRFTCSIRLLDHGDSIAYSYNDLSIDGSKVTAWVSVNDYDLEYHSRRLEVLPDVERLIFAALSLSSPTLRNSICKKK